MTTILFGSTHWRVLSPSVLKSEIDGTLATMDRSRRWWLMSPDVMAGRVEPGFWFGSRDDALTHYDIHGPNLAPMK